MLIYVGGVEENNCKYNNDYFYCTPHICGCFCLSKQKQTKSCRETWQNTHRGNEVENRVMPWQQETIL